MKFSQIMICECDFLQIWKNICNNIHVFWDGWFDSGYLGLLRMITLGASCFLGGIYLANVVADLDPESLALCEALNLDSEKICQPSIHFIHAGLTREGHETNFGAS